MAVSNSSDFSFTFYNPINITILTLKFTATFMQYETQLTFQNMFFFLRLVAFLIKIMKTHLLDKRFQSSYDMDNIFNIMPRFYIMGIFTSTEWTTIIFIIIIIINHKNTLYSHQRKTLPSPPSIFFARNAFLIFAKCILKYWHHFECFPNWNMKKKRKRF